MIIIDKKSVVFKKLSWNIENIVIKDLYIIQILALNNSYGVDMLLKNKSN